jgi:hypothetical protein
LNKLWKKVVPGEGDDEGSSNPIAAAAAKVAAAMAARHSNVEPKPAESATKAAAEPPKLVIAALKPVEPPKPAPLPDPPKPVEAPKPALPTLPIPPVIAPAAAIPVPEEDDKSDDHLLIEVVGVVHPAHRLNRRVHIWNYSSGFSFDSIEDLHQFIYDIRDSGDMPLADLSYCPQDIFLDWSDTMNALRDQEAKVMAEMYDDKVQLIINVTFMVGEEKITTQNYKINFSDSPAQIAAKVSFSYHL